MVASKNIIELKKIIGTNVHRTEAKEKLNSTCKYVGDIFFDNMLYGLTIRSNVAKAKIKSINFAQHINWNEFIIVTHKDIPANNEIIHLNNDQPCLVNNVVNHCFEPILLLAHCNKTILEEAIKHIDIIYEEEKPIFTISDAIINNNHTHKEILIEKGNIEKAFDNAHKIIEDYYETGAQEQLYLETQGMIAFYDKDILNIQGSMQCPYYVHSAVCNVLGLNDDQVRVTQLEIGGAFGGKEEYPSMLAAHVALLCYKSKKPIKMIYNRKEDLSCTTKRHPSFTKIKTAIDENGKITGLHIEFLLDSGAYTTITPVVLSRGSLHICGAYYVPNVKVIAKAYATNNPPRGAFRGFGAPQAFFAIERHIHKIAKLLNLNETEFRQNNLITFGQTMSTSQIMKDSTNLNDMLLSALHEADYFNKMEQYYQYNQTSAIKKGIGYAIFMHGAGFTGTGEQFLASVAGVEGTNDGKIKVLSANTEMGQGKNTIFTQIVAETLQIDMDIIEIARPDTFVVPNSGPTVASRTTMIIGKLVETASNAFKQLLKQEGLLKANYTTVEFSFAIKEYIKKYGKIKAYSEYKIPSSIKWDDNLYQGDAYSTYSWGVYVADIEVSTITGEINVTNFVAMQDIGKVINPILATGQVQGGVAQGIGYAIFENVIEKQGKMINNQLTNYIIPTAKDLPNIKVMFAEYPYFNGPSGAKGLGELPLNGPAPAILNAVSEALGIEFNKIPLMPEVIIKKLQENIQ